AEAFRPGCHARAIASSIFSSALRLLTGIALTLRSIRFTSPESTLPGPISTNVRAPSLTSALAACVKRCEPLRRLHPRGHRRHERRDRLAELDPLDGGAKPLRRSRHERRVERARDAELDRPACALALRDGTALVDSPGLAGDDDLTRAVVVRRPYAEDLPADQLDDFVLEPEDRRHRPRPLASGLGHGESALANERDRLVDRQR